MTKMISLDAALTMFEANENLPTQSVRSLLRQIPVATCEAAMKEAEKIADYHATRNGTASDVLRDIRRSLAAAKAVQK